MWYLETQLGFARRSMKVPCYELKGKHWPSARSLRAGMSCSLIRAPSAPLRSPATAHHQRPKRESLSARLLDLLLNLGQSQSELVRVVEAHGREGRWARADAECVQRCGMV